MNRAVLFSFADRQTIFDAAIDQLARHPFAHPEFFTDAEISALRASALALPFRKARAMVGKNVHQDFDICFPAPIKGVFAQLAKGLEGLVNDLASRQPTLFEMPFTLNDFAVQRYHENSAGIGVHKDALSYRNLVFIITLAGASQLYCCSDRQGSNKQIIHDDPGRLVILPAPGLAHLSDPKTGLCTRWIMSQMAACLSAFDARESNPEDLFIARWPILLTGLARQLKHCHSKR